MLRQLLGHLAKAAKLDSTILLTGESGTGKTYFAREIHRLSPRSPEEFITVSCPALPRELLESELFGHERGAFTGATASRAGRFEQASKGTLFLDEIGDLPQELQPKLLNVLQDREFFRVGGSKMLHTNARVIAATNVNLRSRVEEGSFREDLYYRICEMEIHIPPLRDRQGDKLLLARHFLRIYAEQNNPMVVGFSQEAAESIEAYEWPGNIREMENRVKRAVVMCEDKQIGSIDLGLVTSDGVSINLRQVRLQAERSAILKALTMTENNISAAAKLLGVTRPTLYD
ncbi:MAG: sigma-54-dependent Fis family transcriptional regulator, partial [Sphingobacteriales bacterium]